MITITTIREITITNLELLYAINKTNHYRKHLRKKAGETVRDNQKKTRESEEKEIERLSGIYKKIAEEIDLYVSKELYRLFCGKQITFPVRFYSLEYTKNQIRQKYKRGQSIGKLAQEYSYTQRRIRQILKEKDDN